MSTPRAIVLTGFGINCEEEMAAAYVLAGAQADIVHLNDVFLEKVSIHEYDILNFPGGFSFGDDLGSGKVLANKLQYRRLASGSLFMDELQRFLGDGKFVMGVCNGFQALVKMGLLPNVHGRNEQEVTLTTNNSGKFEDRWVTCRNAGDNRTPFLQGIDVLDLPVRHGEGKLVLSSEAVRERILESRLNCLTYVDGGGNPTDVYPANPNGAALNCAGLTDPTGQIFGLMPHPEAYLALYNHPDWAGRKRRTPELGDDGEGLALFRNVVRAV
jgi:phosphoribosylformylglycinamidine synthase